MLTAIDRMEQMIADMESAAPIYQPTNFWNSGLGNIINDLKKHGLENFREHSSARFFYVPSYETPLWERHCSVLSFIFRLADLLTKQKGTLLKKVFMGENQAESDYRVFRAADLDQGINLSEISESTIGGGERFRFGKKIYGRSFLNYCRGLAFLKKNLNTDDVHSALEIGGGYGALGEILLKARNNFFFINVDIPPLASISTYYLQKVFSKNVILAYEDSRKMDVLEIDKLKQQYKGIVICP